MNDVPTRYEYHGPHRIPADDRGALSRPVTVLGGHVADRTRPRMVHRDDCRYRVRRRRGSIAASTSSAPMVVRPMPAAAGVVRSVTVPVAASELGGSATAAGSAAAEGALVVDGAAAAGTLGDNGNGAALTAVNDAGV